MANILKDFKCFSVVFHVNSQSEFFLPIWLPKFYCVNKLFWLLYLINLLLLGICMPVSLSSVYFHSKRSVENAYNTWIFSVYPQTVSFSANTIYANKHTFWQTQMCCSHSSGDFHNQAPLTATCFSVCRQDWILYNLTSFMSPPVSMAHMYFL